jgi:hypothetical protein
MTRLSRSPVVVKIVLVTVLAAAAIAIPSGIDLGMLNAGPAQPIPFSHRIHATTKQISCFFCHSYASRSSNPGIPSVDKCLLCHKVIATRFAPIHKIQLYDLREKGIPWVRVYQLPHFVHFTHQAHIAAGRDCGECHGDVKAMDRIRLPRTINMDFCTSCHRKNNASVDCVTCHY